MQLCRTDFDISRVDENPVCSMCCVLKMEPVRIFSTRPVNFKIIAGRPVSDWPGRPFFLQKVFVHCSTYLMKNFQKKGRGHG